jgi:hypothetical protein
MVGTERKSKAEKKGEKTFFICKNRRGNNMNISRRNKVNDVLKGVERNVKQLSDILSEECEAYENMPDGLKSSENGIISEEVQEVLESAIDSLYEAIGYLEEV